MRKPERRHSTQPSSKLRAYEGRQGFTIVEALLGMLLIAFSMFALLRFFSYATLLTEKTVLRRQAMGLLQGELERCRALNNNTQSSLATAGGTRTVKLLAQRRGTVAVLAEVNTAVTSGQSDGSTIYDSVYVAVTYDHGEILDTVALAVRFYVQ